MATLATGIRQGAKMPRYFFNLHDDLDVIDEEGVELADFEAATAHGLQNARDMAGLQVAGGKLDLSHRIEIASETGDVLGAIRFRDAVRIVG